MTTAKQWLQEAGFDFENGKILLWWHPNKESGYEDRSYWGDEAEMKKEFVSKEHPRLAQEFDTGFGGVEAPIFMAEDDRAVYVVGCYDGSSWLERIPKGVSLETQIPTVGGG